MSIKDSIKRIKQANSQENKEEDKSVFFSARVPLKYKKHWKSEISKEGKSVQEVLIKLLTQEYGVPEKDNKLTS